MADEIVLWGRANSTNVQKAVWALEEVGVEYTHHQVGGSFGGLDTEEFGKLNPSRLVPVLQHGDMALWESHAIIRYIAARFSKDGLWPEDLRARAIADQWTDWTATIFQPAWIAVFYLLVRTPAAKHNKAEISDAVSKTNVLFSLLERNLQDQPFVAGEALTYADIAVGAAMFRWMSMDVERLDMPKVNAWHKRLMRRPAFIKGVCVSYDDLYARETP